MKDYNDYNKELFRRYLDGELSDKEEQEALHMIADDAGMRELLRFDRSLQYSFTDGLDAEQFSVPEHFTDSVMDRIAALPAKVEEKPDQQNAKIYSLFKTRQISVNPVWAAAAIIIISFGFGFLLLNQDTGQNEFTSVDDYQTSTQVVSESDSEIWIRFVYIDDEAESIEVAGDFSDWDPVALSREYVGDRQVWTGLIPVTRGEHRYMFVRNGEEWLTDPLAAVKKDDGFGNENAVLYL